MNIILIIFGIFTGIISSVIFIILAIPLTIICITILIIEKFFNRLWMASIILLLIFCNCGFNKNFIKPVKDVSWKVLSNEDFQKWGSTAFFIASRYYDATADAVIFSNNPYGASKKKWHLYKNKALTFTMVSVGLKGLGIGQEHFTFEETIKRFIFGECPIAFNIWQWRYHHINYNNAFDYSIEHNSHRYMIPFFDKDRYIKLKPYQMVTIDLISFGTGIYGLIKY